MPAGYEMDAKLLRGLETPFLGLAREEEVVALAGCVGDEAPASAGDELAFAQQASYAIAIAVEREQLMRARDSRGVVGQAQGILMERYKVTADEAFGLLVRSSSVTNRKLRDIADDLASTGTLPTDRH